jgi:hypothetical protein
VQGADILETIAELSVAFAGFTGVVVAFGRRPHHQSSEIDAHAFRAMLAASLQALFFSVFPFLLAASGLEGSRLWRTSSALMLVGLAIGATIDVRFARRADRRSWATSDRILQFAIPAVGLAAGVAQLANVAGVVPTPFAAYLGGLLFFLLFSAVMFVRLVMASDSRRVE